MPYNGAYFPGEPFRPQDVLPSWTMEIDGLEVLVLKGLDFSILTFPDGTKSWQYDDGRIITDHADGSMDVIDPEDDYAAHHSALELAVDAAELETAFRKTMHGDDDLEK